MGFDTLSVPNNMLLSGHLKTRIHRKLEHILGVVVGDTRHKIILYNL